MSISHSAEVMIGVWFDTEGEAKDFAVDNGLVDYNGLTDDDISSDTFKLADVLDLLCFTEDSGYFDSGGCIGLNVNPSHLLEGCTFEIDMAWSILKSSINEEFHGQIKPYIWVRDC